MYKFIYILVFSLFLSLNSSRAHDVDVHVLLSDIAGMTMQHQKEKGMGRGLLEKALEHANLTYHVRFLPWPRLLEEIKRNPKAVMLPLSRNSVRESSYRWIRPIFRAEIGFVSTIAPVHNLEKARHLESIGVWKDTVFEDYLKKEGFTNLMPFHGDQHLGQILDANRTQTWFGELNESRYRLNTHFSKEGTKVFPVYLGRAVLRTKAWLVSNLSFETEKINRLEKALDELYENGTADELYGRYYEFNGN